MAAFHTTQGRPREKPLTDDQLRERVAEGRKELLRALDGFDAEQYLRSAGLSPAEIGRLRRRLVP
ncbi:hypothetical protein J2M53_02970 [Arthrobacter sp. zg-ZUI100]|uniref:hypothetical protein n=1 Tax=Arthrobacter jiangjiafuii TaxID=2817475 RepID=UPI001AEE8BD0|nr:hypothetical protein [Arthrobacter jiangjiafuii]MBP3035218.1 hypothetical protein [Arthrobacter jiangjiafuii]